MSGKIVVSTSPKFYFPKVKALSKKLGVTINDVVMCALSTGFKEYFKIKGDPLGLAETKGNLSVLIPASIRWSFPETREEVECANKFASLPISIPLCEKMQDSYYKI